ncbi:MAG: RHS repeat domain-containing protein, partial [Planctomycetota bacterium]
FRYVYGSYVDEPLLRHAGTGTTLPTSGTAALYYHRNQQYSIVGLSDAAGTLVERYAYTAYGELTILAPDRTLRPTSSFENRYTYTAREWDPTLRLYYFRARWLEPKAGRFIGRDPLGYVDGMGLYGAYWGVRGVDPYGTSCQNPGEQVVCCTTSISRGGYDEIDSFAVKCDKEANHLKCCQKFAKGQRGKLIDSSPNPCYSRPDCDTANEFRKKLAAGIHLLPALRNATPKNWENGQTAIDLLGILMRFSPRDRFKNVRRSELDEILVKLRETYANLARQEGVAIWVKVTGECCDGKQFSSKDYFHKCTAAGRDRGIGFDFDDLDGIAEALDGCIQAAIDNYDCTQK